MLEKTISIIGAGAAGCFAAAVLRDKLSGQASEGNEADGASAGRETARRNVSIEVYEAGARPLAKVAITGGGRCNLTNTFEGVEDLRKVYPRGANAMRRALGAFSQMDTMRWFESAGVPLTIQPDQCVFPKSQDAMDIVRALRKRMGDITVHTGKRLKAIRAPKPETEAEEKPKAGFELIFEDGTTAHSDIVLFTVGGLKRLPELPEGIDITPLRPSLFTFKIDDDSLRGLMGIVAPDAKVSLVGTSFKAEGPLLITDWGLSGPAALKLSSYAAIHLADNNYQAHIAVNWAGVQRTDAEQYLCGLPGAKLLSSCPPEGLQKRLWQHIINKSGIREDIRAGELGSKGRNRLAETLTADTYTIIGRAKFREEFVTAGGIDLGCIDTKTFQAKKVPGLFFAGEILDIDAITGGFNLQAAWSTAWCAANAIYSYTNSNSSTQSLLPAPPVK